MCDSHRFLYHSISINGHTIKIAVFILTIIKKVKNNAC